MKRKNKKPYFESSMGDPDVWKSKLICHDCVNKDGGGCFVFSEGGEAPDPMGRLEAQSTGKCEWYIKHTKI